MAGNFNLTAQIHLQAPNAKQFSRDLQRQLQNPNIKVNLQGGAKTVKDLNNVAKATRNVEKSAQRAGKGADYLGRQLGSAFKQIMKYDIARRVFSLFANSIEQGVRDAIAFERAMVKVAQVSGATANEMRSLEKAISATATSLGVNSAALARTSLILKQTGLSLKDTRIAMQALAKTELAPTFDNIADTAEMAVAAMRQFGLEASKLEGLLGKINVVAANFAVESSDIGVAIRRAGGAFKSAGGSVEELIALFTSVRATTRETAETIATGFRTIFTRLQRPTTIKFLRQFGIELTDLSGKFVGPYEAVNRLNQALRGLDPRDMRYSMIVEQLGGFRQVSKVIPLIQQFGTAQAALNAQQAESGSLAADAARAQQTLAVQLQQLTENVKELFREIVSSDAFQTMAKGAISLANAIVKMGKAIAPVLPILTAMLGLKAAGWAGGKFLGGGFKGLNQSLGGMGGTGGPGFYNRGGRVRRFNRGGWVPGSGNGDTVPALLEPGEFVLRKSAAQAFGPQLASINRYGNGGRGKTTKNPDQSVKSSVPYVAKAKFRGTYDGDSYQIYATPARTDWKTTTRQTGYDAYEMRSGTAAEKKLAQLGKKIAAKHAAAKGWEVDSVMSGVSPMPQGDKYGRPQLTMEELQTELIRKGLAVPSGQKATGSLAQRRAAATKAVNAAKAAKKAKPKLTAAGTLPIEGYPPLSTFASGGLVPSLLTPGEFVVNKKSAQRMGYGKLSQMNRFASGGAVGVRRYSNGTGSSGVLPMGFGGGFNPLMMMGMFGGFSGGLQDAEGNVGSFGGSVMDAAQSAMFAYTKFALAGSAAEQVAVSMGVSAEASAYLGERITAVGGALSVLSSLANSALGKGVGKAAQSGMRAFGMGGRTTGKALMNPLETLKGIKNAPSTIYQGTIGNKRRAPLIQKLESRYAADRARRAPLVRKREALWMSRRGMVGQLGKQQDILRGLGQTVGDRGHMQYFDDAARQKHFSNLTQKGTRRSIRSMPGAKGMEYYLRASREPRQLSKGLQKGIAAADDEIVKLTGNIHHLNKSAGKSSATMAKLSKQSIQATAKLTKLGRGVATMGVSIAAEETVGYVGRSITEDAMAKISEGEGKMSLEDEKSAITTAAVGGAISDAAVGAGIGLLLAPFTGGLSIAVGAIIGGLYGWFDATRSAARAIERANFERASTLLSDSMKKFSEGAMSGGVALNRVFASQNELGSLGAADEGYAGAVSVGEKLKLEAEQRNAAAQILGQRAGQKGMTKETFAADTQVQEALKRGLITPEQLKEFNELIEETQRLAKEQKAFSESIRIANREIRRIQGLANVFQEVERRMGSFGTTIDNIASPTGSIRLGEQSMFDVNTRDPASIKRMNKAFDVYGNIAGEGNSAFVSGSGLGGTAAKASDAAFMERNLEDILQRASIGGGLDAEGRRDVIARELESSLQEEGHTLSEYMRNRIDGITRGLGEEELGDIEGNMDKIMDAYQHGNDRFLAVFQEAEKLVQSQNKRLAQAYEAKLKLEQEYIKRQSSLMQARFDSEEKFRQNLSASAFASTSNADIQGNFMNQQNLLASGSGGIGGLSPARLASLNAAGGVGNVNAVGATFKEISAELRQNQQELMASTGGIDPNTMDPNDPLIESNKELIQKNKELQQEYDASKQILENYANSQQRLIALNEELNQAQQKRKSLRDLAIQARYGTAEEKDQAARLINAITIASQQGIDAVAPDMQRAVVGYLPQLMGAEGEGIVNQGIEDAFGGGKGIAGITEVSAEEKRLATEIKAIEDAGITAGEHLAEEVGDRVTEMADTIEQLQSKFISELRTLMLQEEERQAKEELKSADAQLASMNKQNDILNKYGIEDKTQLDSIRANTENLFAAQKASDKASSALDFNIGDAVREGTGSFVEVLDELKNQGQNAAIGMGRGTQAQNLMNLLGVNDDELSDALDEGGSGILGSIGSGNEYIKDLEGSQIKAYEKMVRNLRKKAVEMGMDGSAIDNIVSNTEANESSKANDTIANILKSMARFQDQTTGGADDTLNQTIERMKEAGVSQEVIEKLRNANAEEQKQILKDLGAIKDVDSPAALKESIDEQTTIAQEARDHLDNVQQDMNILATKGANPGSIYTHDIHCQAVLLNILSVLEGQGQTVDMGASAAQLQKSGVGGAISSAKATQSAGIMMSGAMSQDATKKFMDSYGGKSLRDVENMSDDEKQRMLDSMKNANIPESQKKELEAMAGSMGMGDFGLYGASAFEKSSFSKAGADESTTLGDALGPNVVKEVMKSLTEGAAAGTLAAQTQAALAQLGINDTAEMFSKNIEEFSAAMGNPLSIEVGGSIEVNVNMNGADFLKNAEGALAEIAGSEASKAINNFIQQMNKSSNVKANPQGWHQSGQPKPLTGNG